MTRRQVLVQLDDDLVDRLDRLASNLGTNRSDLLRRAAWTVLRAADLAEADAELQAAYRRVPQDIVFLEALGRVAAKTVPEW